MMLLHIIVLMVVLCVIAIGGGIALALILKSRNKKSGSAALDTEASEAASR